MFFSAILTKLDWLVECILRKVAVDCDPYLYHLTSNKAQAMADEQATAPSPASKRNILLMSQTSKQGTPKRLNFNDSNSSMNASKNESPSDKTLLSQTNKEQAEDDLIDQYLNAQPAPAPVPAAVREPVAGPSKAKDDNNFKVPAQPQPQAQAQVQAQSLQQSSNDTESEYDSEYDYTPNSAIKFLANLKVMFRGFDSESHESLAEDCQIAGAEIIDDDNYKGTIDFLIMPVDAMSMHGTNVKAKQIVNQNWLVSWIRSRI